ncbi:YheC/YheD family protein [Salinithrix halophila]|uniref:YheC/YheD family protein n=1 Tax=Salinithrix halophila TaxID=1485204 RepID=A0ABV8JFM7_9BACL
MRRYRQIASKALKTQVMLTNAGLRKFIPATSWYSGKALEKMMAAFPTVFIKPDKGGGGAGIVRVRQREDSIEICYRKECRCTDSRSLHTVLDNFLNPHKRYLIQQGIEMAKVGGRPFDIRILMQKPKSEWMVGGMAAKVAAKGLFITNHCKGGKPLPVEEALDRAYGQGNPLKSTILSDLIQIGRLTAEVLDSRFPGIRELGLDVGPDSEGRLWIFEVNTRPNFHLFRRLERDQYRRIIHRHKKLV